MMSVRSSSVVALRLTASVARKRIRAAIKDTENIKWTDHVMERMEQRSLTTGDVLGILASGDVEDAPVLQANGRDWKCKVVNKVRGRIAGVVTVICSNDRLILVTAEWEDGK